MGIKSGMEHTLRQQIIHARMQITRKAIARVMTVYNQSARASVRARRGAAAPALSHTDAPP